MALRNEENMLQSKGGWWNCVFHLPAAEPVPFSRSRNCTFGWHKSLNRPLNASNSDCATFSISREVCWGWCCRVHGIFLVRKGWGEIERAKGLTKKLATHSIFIVSVWLTNLSFLNFSRVYAFFGVFSHSFFTHRDSSYPSLYDPSSSQQHRKDSFPYILQRAEKFRWEGAAGTYF